MRRPRPGPLLGLASALLVIALVWADRAGINPGPLHAVHAIEPLVGRGGCVHCHGDGEGGRSMSDACADCHAEVREQVARGTGFHGTLDAPVGRCGDCHPEHAGAEVPLAGARSFARAGVPDRDAYEHAGLGFRLAGAHRSLACRECHPHADAPRIAPGTKRFLGLSQDCASCHEDPHAGALPDCGSCHGEERPFAKVANFSHPASFPLSGAHAAPRCLECHPKGGPHAVEAIAVAAGRPSRAPARSRACADCHASPHAAPFLAALAARSGVAPGASCEACHATTRESFAAPAASMTRDDHGASGFPLDPPHERAACAACHPEGEGDFRAAHPGRRADDCAACHVDPHGGEFDRGRFAGRGCLACHERHAFAPPAFGVARHAETAFPLAGSHAAVPCAQCHGETVAVRDDPARRVRVFHGTPSTCEACHADAHEGFFHRPGLLADAERARGCALCHTAGSFSEVSLAFDHARRTGFPLGGAHARAACAACHPASTSPDAAGRVFGRATPTAAKGGCVSCHADPHAGRFAKYGEPGCQRCHTTESFSGARRGFDHAAWTGYALEGLHERLACEACHERAPARRPGTPASLGRARGTDCASCHADPHAGQFAKNGATACERCHATGVPFESVRFDHDTGSRFRLDEGHRRLACSACHRAFPVAGGGEAVRYRPLGTACGDCHSHGGKRR